MTRVSDAYVVSQTELFVIRKCPFCEELIEDTRGTDINLIVHLGSPSTRHRTNRMWAEYVTAMNRV